VRGGSALLLHSVASYTTEETRSKPYALLVSLSSATGSATGFAIIDDGITRQKKSLDVTFTAQRDHVSGGTKGEYRSPQPLAEVSVLGVSSKPSSIKFNGTTTGGNWTYESGLQRLNVTGLDIALHSNWNLTWA